VRSVWGKTYYYLVTGLHRLEAMKQLGKTTIPCFILKGDKRAARMWEISENLHRADLTAEEYDEQLAEWVRLFEADQAISGQNVQKRGPGRPESGISEAARQLPVKGKTDEAKRKRVARALKVAAISSEAKEAAKKAGLNHTQRLKVAEEKTSEAQVAKVHELAARKSETGKKRRSSDVPQEVTREADFETPVSADDKKYLADLVKKWNAARELKPAFISAAYHADVDGKFTPLGSV
jgi:ParB-like chromosome segregation protein Spo0J